MTTSHNPLELYFQHCSSISPVLLDQILELNYKGKLVQWSGVVLSVQQNRIILRLDASASPLITPLVTLALDTPAAKLAYSSLPVGTVAKFQGRLHRLGISLLVEAIPISERVPVDIALSYAEFMKQLMDGSQALAKRNFDALWKGKVLPFVGKFVQPPGPPSGGTSFCLVPFRPTSSDNFGMQSSFLY
jgi:hypothetical protein